MRRSGYLTTVSDPADGRAKLVRLTRRGKKAMQTLLALSQPFEDRLADAIGIANMKHLRGLLEQVSAALDRR